MRRNIGITKRCATQIDVRMWHVTHRSQVACVEVRHGFGFFLRSSTGDVAYITIGTVHAVDRADAFADVLFYLQPVSRPVLAGDVAYITLGSFFTKYVARLVLRDIAAVPPSFQADSRGDVAYITIDPERIFRPITQFDE